MPERELPEDGVIELGTVRLDGRRVAPDPAVVGGPPGPPVLWVTRGAVGDAGATWLAIGEPCQRSGWSRVLLASRDGDGDDRPWFTGEFDPSYDPPTGEGAETVMERWWDEVLVDDDEGYEGVAPFGAMFPGLAPATTGQFPDETIIEEISSFAARHIGIAVGETPADIVRAIGWMGAVNTDQSASDLATILTSWHRRFGAVLVELGFDTMELVVARPPATFDEALRVAAEQYAFCFDIVDQGVGDVRAHAEELVGAIRWSFWWD